MGLVIVAAAVISITAYGFMPTLVHAYGPRKLGVFLSVVTGLSLFVLSLDPNPAVSIFLIALASAATPLIAYQLDLLLEASSHDEKKTGSTRALFITTANIALIATPLLLGLLLGPTQFGAQFVHEHLEFAISYEPVFRIAALSLIPAILLLLFARFPEGNHVHLHLLRSAARCLVRDTDLRAVLVASFLLQFFFFLAPLYIPLYLHTVLGIPWSELGWMFSVMLLPFILLEYPAAWLADNKWGDRELMALGFTIMGLFFAAIAFIGAETSLGIILFILVFTRIGAALVEAMVEGHFFRRITASDSSSIAVFRLTRPLAMLLAPLAATVMLLFMSFNLFFLLSGVFILIAGVVSAFYIKDFN